MPYYSDPLAKKVNGYDIGLINSLRDKQYKSEMDKVNAQGEYGLKNTGLQGEYGLKNTSLQGKNQLDAGQQQGEYSLSNTKLAGDNALKAINMQNLGGLENTKLLGQNSINAINAQNTGDLERQKLVNEGTLANTGLAGKTQLDAEALRSKTQMTTSALDNKAKLDATKLETDTAKINNFNTGQSTLNNYLLSTQGILNNSALETPDYIKSLLNPSKSSSFSIGSSLPTSGSYAPTGTSQYGFRPMTYQDLTGEKFYSTGGVTGYAAGGLVRQADGAMTLGGKDGFTDLKNREDIGNPYADTMRRLAMENALLASKQMKADAEYADKRRGASNEYLDSRSRWMADETAKRPARNLGARIESRYTEPAILEAGMYPYINPRTGSMENAASFQASGLTSSKMMGMADGGRLIEGKVDPTVADDTTIKAKIGEYVLSVEDVALLGGADKIQKSIAMMREENGVPTKTGPKGPNEPDNRGRFDKPGLDGVFGAANGGSLSAEELKRKEAEYEARRAAEARSGYVSIMKPEQKRQSIPLLGQRAIEGNYFKGDVGKSDYDDTEPVAKPQEKAAAPNNTAPKEVAPKKAATQKGYSTHKENSPSGNSGMGYIQVLDDNGKPIKGERYDLGRDNQTGNSVMLKNGKLARDLGPAEKPETADERHAKDMQRIQDQARIAMALGRPREAAQLSNQMNAMEANRNVQVELADKRKQLEFAVKSRSEDKAAEVASKAETALLKAASDRQEKALLAATNRQTGVLDEELYYKLVEADEKMAKGYKRIVSEPAKPKRKVGFPGFREELEAEPERYAWEAPSGKAPAVGDVRVNPKTGKVQRWE